MGNVETLLAYGFSALATLAAFGFVLFRQPVHAALSFAVTVLSGAGLYLLADAPYAATATVIVYAGATIIIFLFALMFSQQSTLPAYDQIKSNPVGAFFAVAALIWILVYAASSFKHSDPTSTSAISAEAGVISDGATGISSPTVADLGRVMYTQYLWAIEVAGTILLVATLGAIRIAHDSPRENPYPQSGIE